MLYHLHTWAYERHDVGMCTHRGTNGPVVINIETRADVVIRVQTKHHIHKTIDSGCTKPT